MSSELRHPLTVEDGGPDVLHAVSVSMPPDHRGFAHFLAVGRGYFRTGETIEKITVSCDMPGPECDLERVCVWGGHGQLLWECPLHRVSGVSYVTGRPARAS